MNSVSENSPTGYILNVDLKYPDELHTLDNVYPLAPQKLQFLMICRQIIVKKLQTNME